MLVPLELDPEELLEGSFPFELESHGPKLADEIVNQILVWGREDTIVDETNTSKVGEMRRQGSMALWVSPKSGWSNASNKCLNQRRGAMEIP
jgi:hypothetical protein